MIPKNKSAAKSGKNAAKNGTTKNGTTKNAAKKK
jgi:hypothetical protein